jgi:hypothetical protein
MTDTTKEDVQRALDFACSHVAPSPLLLYPSQYDYFEKLGCDLICCKKIEALTYD